MQRIVKYEVVSGSDAGRIIRVVNQMILEGWQPIGGITIAIPSPGGESPPRIYSQAMVRYAD